MRTYTAQIDTDQDHKLRAELRLRTEQAHGIVCFRASAHVIHTSSGGGSYGTQKKSLYANSACFFCAVSHVKERQPSRKGSGAASSGSETAVIPMNSQNNDEL